jgi:hypothetical protein
MVETEFGFSGAFRGLVDTTTARALLDSARSGGFRLVVNLAGSRALFQNADRSFSLSKFADRLQRFQGFDFAPYVADGTIVGHTLFDEPHDPSNWNGQPVPFATIDSAAAVSTGLWPALAAGVGSPHSFLAPGAPWAHLAYAQPQYTTRRGEVTTWLASEMALAAGDGLETVLSLNVLNTNSPDGPLTPAQLEEYGSVLAAEPTALALLYWKWDPAYFATPGMQASLDAVAAAACTATGAATPGGIRGAVDFVFRNPQRGQVHFAFALAHPAHVLLAVYDARGRRVASLLDAERGVGAHALLWEAGNFPAGVYMARLVADGTAASRHITVLR